MLLLQATVDTVAGTVLSELFSGGWVFFGEDSGVVPSKTHMLLLKQQYTCRLNLLIKLLSKPRSILLPILL